MRYTLAGTGALLLLLAACNKQEVEYLQTLPASENPGLVQTDTFAGNFTVYRPDSFVTSSKTAGLLGYHNDAVFGKITATPYLRPALPATGPELTNNPVYDSLVLILRLNKSWYGDTSAPITVGAYRVTQDIKNETNVFYNTQSFASSPTALGSTSIKLRPTAGDSLRIKLSDAFGSEIFQYYKTNNTTVTDATAFQDYFKGIALKTSGTTNAVYGFNTTTYSMRLYYHIDVSRREDKYIDFTPGDNAYQFYNLQADRNGSSLQALVGAKEVNAASLGNKFMIQEMTGVRTRIAFAGIKELPKQASFVKLLKAELEVKPVGGITSMYPIPQQMHLYLRTGDGTENGPQTYSDGQTTQTGSLYIDAVYGKDTRYVYDVTSYVTNEINTNTYTSQSLVLVPSGSDTALNRLIGGTSSNSEFRTRLIVSMLTYTK